MIDEETARFFREEYAAGKTIREIDEENNYRGSHAVVANRIWRDPTYVPPERPSGPQPALYECDGEMKSAKQWSEDSRCQVTLRELRRRLSGGEKLPAAFRRRSAAGRPRGS